MKYIINGKEYTFYKDFQNNTSLRHSMDLLAQQTFGGLTFEKWYQQGFWSGKYIPYTLFDGDKAVASVLAVIFDIELQGEGKRYIQLSTVMTDPEYRKHGLLRFLMEKVLEEWRTNCDGMYLYANDRVLEFYPRFGFVMEKEFQFSMPIYRQESKIRNLDISEEKDRKLFLDKCKNANPFAAIGMGNSHEIIMFHCIMFMENCIYYLEEYDVIVIAEQEEETMLCYDIYGDTTASLCEIVSKAAKPQCKKVKFGFTPKNTNACEVALYEEGDTTLFVLKEKDNIFKDRQIMLPIICHA